MIFLVVLLCTCALALGGVIPSFDDRIIGGEATTIEELPYQVSLRYKGNHNCGGSILNQDTILTAAHCIVGFQHALITVRVGGTVHSQGEEFQLARIVVHPEYFQGAQYNNDIAVMKLAKPLTFTDKVQPIALADSPVEAGTVGVVSGWGTTVAGVQITPDVLRKVNVDIISSGRCQSSYEGAMTITDTMLCAQTPNKDSCQGDSGGPLAAGGRLVGVVSWGFGCADPAYPGVYADVAALRSFVDQYLGPSNDTILTIEELPYQVSLRYKGNHNCGGSILNQDTILTAAHCIVGFQHALITVRVGATVHSQGEEFQLARIVVHPEYFQGAQYNNDIAVMKLAKPLTFTDKVQPIALADSPVEAGTVGVVSGWGTTVAGVQITPDVLRKVNVDVISSGRCQSSYEGAMTITDTMLCAQTPNKDSCQGDSGGPLAAGGRLVGVVSWGFGCADPAYPGVYADVAALRSFVDQYL